MVDGEMWEAKTELQGELELSELCESEANFTWTVALHRDLDEPDCRLHNDTRTCVAHHTLGAVPPCMPFFNYFSPTQMWCRGPLDFIAKLSATNGSDWNKLETSVGPRIDGVSTLSGLIKVANNVPLENDLSLRKCSVWVCSMRRMAYSLNVLATCSQQNSSLCGLWRPTV